MGDNSEFSLKERKRAMRESITSPGSVVYEARDFINNLKTIIVDNKAAFATYPYGDYTSFSSGKSLRALIHPDLLPSRAVAALTEAADRFEHVVSLCQTAENGQFTPRLHSHVEDNLERINELLNRLAHGEYFTP